MTLGTARNWSFGLWTCMLVFLVSLFIVQTLAGKYNGSVSAAWGWLSATLVPTWTLLASLRFSPSVDQNVSERISIEQKLFLFVSIGLYLLFILLIVLLEPFSAIDYLNHYNQFALPLAAVQGICITAITTSLVR